MRPFLTKPSFHGAALAAFTLLSHGVARAEDTCSIQGESILGPTVSLYDAPSGGAELARFTGAKVGLTVREVPKGGSSASVETTGFRLRGFVRLRDLPLYTARTVQVFMGHVWISDGRQVKILATSGARAQIERTVAWPMIGSFQGWAACTDLTLSERVPSGFTPEGGSRGYVVKRTRIELYTAPDGDVVTAIEPSSSEAKVLLWSDRREGGWVHVEYHGDVILDGWVRSRDVSALPPGETMDQLAPSAVQHGSPRLQLATEPRTVRVTTPQVIRGAASDASAVIGAIDPGTDVLVLDVVAGWASVVPKSLTVAPAGTAQFWVRAKELGI